MLVLLAMFGIITPAQNSSKRVSQYAPMAIQVETGPALGTLPSLEQTTQGHWKPAGAAFQHDLVLPYYDTSQFYGLCAVFLLLVVWLIYRLRVAGLVCRNNELEEKVAQRTADLQQALEAAQSSARAKGTFLANMSHEIRTPLNGILGMTSLLLEMRLGQEAAEAVRIIRNSSEILMKLLNEILDLSKIESGKLELDLEPFELRRCIEETVALFSYHAAEKGLSLRFFIAEDVPFLLRGDASRLCQILNNLISNAIKFSNSGEVSVSVRTRGVCDQREKLHFTVQDHGIGIASDKLNRLFQTFSQADSSTSRKYGGTGLGLAICRHLTELMGGRIWVESAPGCGSSFHFIIVMESMDAGTQPATISAPASPEVAVSSNDTPIMGKALRILLADDNPINQKVAVRLLEKLGHHSDIAHDGKEAMQMLIENEYDIAFMDIQMPYMDGLEVSRRIQEQTGPNKKPWIIAMTANALGGDREACMASGMSDYISKPININALREALQRYRMQVGKAA
jgi:signal transduction histidine kinase/ActR/RegA family two-component response regulator